MLSPCRIQNINDFYFKWKIKLSHLLNYFPHYLQVNAWKEWDASICPLRLPFYVEFSPHSEHKCFFTSYGRFNCHLIEFIWGALKKNISKNFRHWLNPPYPIISPSMVQSTNFFSYSRSNSPPFQRSSVTTIVSI